MKSISILIFFLFSALIFTEYELEGKWIAPSFSPEKIIEIKKKGDIYEAYEVKQTPSSANTPNSKWLFKFDIKNKRTFSQSDEGDVLLARSDLWIDDGGGHIHRDSRSKSKKMFCMSNVRERLPDSLLKNLSSLRNKAAKHCLSCKGGKCSMNIWPEGNEKEALICKRLFCQPIETTKSPFIEGDTGFGRTIAEFNFSISKTGNIVNVNVLSAFGEMNKTRSEDFLSDYLKFLNFQPIEIDEINYELINLRGVVKWNINER
jgi:hypothetical protein